jgi:programmed cell death 6-interacting protein
MTAAVKFDLSLMSWPWYNAFGKEKKLTIGSSLSFEKSAVLFNLAILYANIGVDRILNGKADEEGLKKAALLFSQSAGVLQFLEEKVKEEGLGAKGNCQLRALSSLMLAMGQECFVLKAIKGGTKDSIIAKLAYSAAKLYGEAHQICVDEATDFDKDDVAYCFGKAELNRARAQYYRGNDDAANAKYGEQIARFEVVLRVCKDALASKQAKHLSNHVINDLKSIESLITASLPKLKKDNELICKLFYIKFRHASNSK